MHIFIFQVKGVLVGFDPHLSYIKMIKAASYANNPENLFIATNEDSFLPTPEDHIVIPGNALHCLPAYCIDTALSIIIHDDNWSQCI